MRKPQKGYLFEANGAWHIRFYLCSVKGKRIQRSHKLCDKSEDTPSKDSPVLLQLAANFMQGVNAAAASERNGEGHKCPLCLTRCNRTVEGKFTRRRKNEEVINVNQT